MGLDTVFYNPDKDEEYMGVTRWKYFKENLTPDHRALVYLMTGPWKGHKVIITHDHDERSRYAPGEEGNSYGYIYPKLIDVPEEYRTWQEDK